MYKRELEKLGPQRTEKRLAHRLAGPTGTTRDLVKVDSGEEEDRASRALSKLREDRNAFNRAQMAFSERRKQAAKAAKALRQKQAEQAKAAKKEKKGKEEK